MGREPFSVNSVTFASIVRSLPPSHKATAGRRSARDDRSDASIARSLFALGMTEEA